MPLSNYAKWVAAKELELRKVALSKMPEIRSRLLDLMNNPALRDPDIVNDYLEAGYLEDVEAAGADDLSAAYWAQVGELAQMSWDDLLKGADGNQSGIIEDAKNIIFSAAQVQAQMESGVPIDAIREGVEGFEMRQAALAGMSADDIKNLKYDVKGELEKLKKAEKDGSR
jgi:hypothetical protein